MTIDDWRARYDHLNAETDRLRAEVARLREDADKWRDLYVQALDKADRLREDSARNRWCEKAMADVRYSGACGEWTVEWEVSHARFAHKISRDRNAAIDAARGKV